MTDPALKEQPDFWHGYFDASADLVRRTDIGPAYDAGYAQGVNAKALAFAAAAAFAGFANRIIVLGGRIHG